MSESCLVFNEFPAARVAFVNSASEIPGGSRCLIAGTEKRKRKLAKALRRKRPDIDLLGQITYGGLISAIGGLSFARQSRVCNPSGSMIIISDPSWSTRIGPLISQGFGKFIVMKFIDVDSSVRNCIVCHEKKFIFVPIYKALYTSIREFLRNNFREFRNAPQVTQGLNTRVDLENPRFDGYFKFSIARNPWDRVVSCYRDKIDRPYSHDNYQFWHAPILTLLGGADITFEQFVSFIARMPDSHADRHWLSQSASLFDGSGKQLVDYIGRFESLKSALGEISDVIGIDLAVEHLNRSNTETRQAPILIDAAIDGLIRRRYAEDILRLGYDFPKDDCRVA
jgi:hypothetical protein